MSARSEVIDVKSNLQKDISFDLGDRMNKMNCNLVNAQAFQHLSF